MQLFRSHGMTRDAAAMSKPSDGPWYYEQVALGYNYRMTELHAALGLSQFARLSDFVRRRHAVADRYDSLLAELPIVRPWRDSDCVSAFHLYIVRVPSAPGLASHRKVFESLRASGVGVNLHYIPVYLQPYYRKLGFEPGYCANAEAYYAEAISLPIFPALSNEQQDHVVNSLREALS
jgi:dTDP-4-amino-4,6-dideoxygalactose transaminase